MAAVGIFKLKYAKRFFVSPQDLVQAIFHHTAFSSSEWKQSKRKALKPHSFCLSVNKDQTLQPHISCLHQVPQACCQGIHAEYRTKLNQYIIFPPLKSQFTTLSRPTKDLFFHPEWELVLNTCHTLQAKVRDLSPALVATCTSASQLLLLTLKNSLPSRVSVSANPGLDICIWSCEDGITVSFGFSSCGSLTSSSDLSLAGSSGCIWKANYLYSRFRWWCFRIIPFGLILGADATLTCIVC